MLLSPCKVSHTRNHPPASSGVHQTKCLNAWLPCHHRKDYTAKWRGHSPELYLVSVSSTCFRTVEDKMEQLLPGTETYLICFNRFLSSTASPLLLHPNMQICMDAQYILLPQFETQSLNQEGEIGCYFNKTRRTGLILSC